MISRGFDVNGSSDQFTFAYASIGGDVTIIARLNTVPNVDPWAQAGLMIRDGLGTGARHVFVLGTPGNGVVTRHRQRKRSSTSQTSGGTSATPIWLKLQRRSSTFTASRSADGTSWTTIHTVTVSMPSTALVGFAVASHSNTVGLTATLDSVSINGQSWAASNLPPTVSLTSPTSGAGYSSPASVALSATAADTDGTVAKLEFYAGASLIATDTTSPYTFSWTGVAAGSYGIKAIATDNKGASTTSATATITVGANNPPTVSMTSPAHLASFVEPTWITFAATATDTDGTVQKVEFYLGTTLVATDTTSPFSTTWPALVGSYSVSAVATDDKGAKTASAWRDYTVTGSPVLSTAVFKPASPDDAVDYYVLEIFAAGADPSTAAPLATQNIGLPPVVAGECSADVRATVVGLAAGNYIATVASVGSQGTLRSNAFSFSR